MNVNVGNTDRMIRLAVGIIGLLLGLFGPFGTALSWVLTIVGVVMLVVAATRICPLYSILGKSTCPMDK
ncbi:MAG: hypothetical protein CSA72_03745 [Rhodobacterales bacterium]|nr:MAG: hypothetical protein CSA72_03745 [Rhodobacterales bacterium]